jgi:nucleoside-diphosphate-sugar epimerase
MGAVPVKRALVTGSEGFVGRHMRVALEAAGWSVSGLDIKRGPAEDVRDVFREDDYHYDLLVHCAAVVGGRELIEGNPLALAVNLEIDAAMFSWALRTKPGRVVYFSSSAAYPVGFQSAFQRVRLTEAHIDLTGPRAGVGMPDQLYGWSKLTGEVLAVHARRAGVPVTVLRPFSGYGADQDLDYPFPSFIDRAARRANPFDIWGDGSQVRDWIHISDIIGATMTCIDEGIDGPLNLGWGRPTSFLELAHLVATAAQILDSTVFKIHPEKPSGVAWRVCDPTEMLKVYRPKITLEEGIVQALAAKVNA